MILIKSDQYESLFSGQPPGKTVSILSWKDQVIKENVKIIEPKLKFENKDKVKDFCFL